MKQYLKKPVVIEALMFTDEPARLIEFSKFIKKSGWLEISYKDRKNPQMSIDNLNGSAMQASIGDYVVKGANGDIYSVKPDVFERNHESVGKNKYVAR